MVVIFGRLLQQASLRRSRWLTGFGYEGMKERGHSTVQTNNGEIYITEMKILRNQYHVDRA